MTFHSSPIIFTRAFVLNYVGCDKRYDLWYWSMCTKEGNKEILQMQIKEGEKLT